MYALGLTTGALVEYTAFDQSYPCANDAASIAQQAWMIYYLKKRADPAAETWKWQIKATPYIVSMLKTLKESECRD
jgi:hypothetical protein